MSKQDILDFFSDINHAYNDSTRLVTLNRMLDELIEDAVPRWHRVEDGLPDKNTNVLFYDENGQFHNGVMSRFRGYTEFIDYDGNTLHGITHWMPLPEPPKEE